MMLKFCSSIFLITLLVSCTRNNSERNKLPVDKIEEQVVVASDSTSIVGIYQFIFSKHCDVRGCHDGTFEPNFTTIQSSYYTLVFHPIVKNNRKKSFNYRVVPYDTSNSVLYERITNCCFVNDGDRMPQLNNKEKLSDSEIACVGKWIMNGAKNIDGNTYTPEDLRKH